MSHFIIFRVLFYFLGKIFSEAFYFYINTCIIKKTVKETDSMGNPERGFLSVSVNILRKAV